MPSLEMFEKYPLNIKGSIHNCAELAKAVDIIGFLPLLNMGVGNWSAQAITDKNCQYKRLPNGKWEWLMWHWKGPVIKESGCAYGRFFLGNKGFISKKWWPDFCNIRRSHYPYPEEGSVEESILYILKNNGSMTTKELRVASGFTEAKMRGRFDTFISHLERGCYILTEDFVYPHNKQGQKYGWGKALLTPAENLMGKEACNIDRTPEESLKILLEFFDKIMPDIHSKFFEEILWG